ncbi:abortive phage infection protein [Streptomyces sp. NBC_00243]|uniref:abortive phage infection protein n=1 Tax=Streptomyces sp. NBC_00243 TaxID=2975688 RepID=UPI002DDC0306|nr:abortive phage infection protein [Streptomyces sp. NBC_00243]WRZ20597.1 abortive phage infection protein [Streptomyces sp. NBC_00243]
MQEITRARFLGMAAGVGGAAVLPAAGQASATEGGGGGSGGASGGRGGRGLTYRGVVYEVGEGETPGTAWSPVRMRADMRAIDRDLHANSVKVTGYGVERLTATAGEAAERGLNVWLEPTLGDVPEKEILEHLAETGRFAERLRRQGAGVHLSVGCEFWLFVPGIVPGDNVLERIENLMSGNFDPVLMARRLSRFTAKAARVGRSVFGGRLTYAAAQDDDVDWGLFDLVGIDYYSYFRSRHEYVRDLDRFRRFGKPVAITEFGCCTFEGAPEQGGMGWDVVDYTKEPPEIKGELVRSERTQAAYLMDVLSVFESMGLYSAMAFTFVTPDSPHLPHDPRHDLDMASYSLVKPIKDRPGDPASDWHWEPKESFRALARQYGRAARGC